MTDTGMVKTLEQLEPRTIVTNLPFNITNSGSYYLIQSLFGSDGNYGITIATNEVKLDLNGFSLNGTSNALSGIKVTVLAENISIRNGVIRNWGQFGIDATCAVDVVMVDVKAFGNGYGGLYSGQNAILDRCSCYGNGFAEGAKGHPQQPWDDAIQVGSFSTITGCKTRGNGGAGIHTYDHSRVIGCTSVLHTNATGVSVENYCTVKECTAAQNKIGIAVSDKCRVSENTVGENGIGIAGFPSGIEINGGNNVIERNSVSYNQNGIRVMGTNNLVINNFVTKSPGTEVYVSNPGLNYIGGTYQLQHSADVSTNGPWLNFIFN
jgi:parallel beta-helix repeat protein